MNTSIHFYKHISLTVLKIKVSQTNVVEKFKTHTLCSITFLFENHDVYEVMWNNMVESSRPWKTIWRMTIACRIPKSIDRHSKYAILIAFSLQRWLHAGFQHKNREERNYFDHVAITNKFINAVTAQTQFTTRAPFSYQCASSHLRVSCTGWWFLYPNFVSGSQFLNTVGQVAYPALYLDNNYNK